MELLGGHHAQTKKKKRPRNPVQQSPLHQSVALPREWSCSDHLKRICEQLNKPSIWGEITEKTYLIKTNPAISEKKFPEKGHGKKGKVGSVQSGWGGTCFREIGV